MSTVGQPRETLVTGVELHGLRCGTGIAFNVLGIDHASSSSKIIDQVVAQADSGGAVRSSVAEARRPPAARMNRSSAAFWLRPRQAR